MKLMHDNIKDFWVWVTDLDEQIDLSPRFNEQIYALKWLMDMADQFEKTVSVEDVVPLPKNKEQAEAMLRVASNYLNQSVN